ncbi:MAG TPA: DUF2569 family protein [Allosphingosinicella sp.]|jgi:hypothetical protein
MSYSDDQLYGVRGWLAFLCISLMALGPLANLAITFADLGEAQRANPLLAASPEWTTMKIVVWTITLVQVAMMIYTGWRLNHVFRRSTVKFTIVMLWVIGPVWGLLTVAVIGFLAGGNPFDSSTLFELARPAAWALAWTLYLIMSRRVANTYDQEGSEEQAEAELSNVFE